MAGETPSPYAGSPPVDKQASRERSASDINKLYGGLESSSSRGGTKDPWVYVGRPTSGYVSDVANQFFNTQKKASTLVDEYHGWTPLQRDRFLTQLSLAGYDTKNMKDIQIKQAWASYVGQAAGYIKQQLTPWDILAKDRQQREAMNLPRTVTQSSTSYDLSTAKDAHAIFLQASQSLLGRDPTKAEISAFQKSLNAYEQANPTVTTQTSNYIGDQLTSQTSTTKGGVKAEARGLMAMEDAKRDPEYGAFQASTTYYDAMMEMIRGG